MVQGALFRFSKKKKKTSWYVVGEAPKAHFQGCRFHNREKVEMAVRESLRRQEPMNNATYFLNYCQDVINASVFSEIMFEK
jgi:hypothetical protein